MTQSGADAARSEHREAFWSLVVGAPAALSVLRLWVESGGQLQVTLLLVSNVNPLNLAAALFATTTHLVSGVLVALFAAAGILRATAGNAEPGSRLRTNPPLALRAADYAPRWFVAGAFVLAALTWKILYAPLLLPAAVAAFQRPAWRLLRPPFAVAGLLAALGGYYWLVLPAVHHAAVTGEWQVGLLLAVPPLVAAGVAGPLPHPLARPFATAAHAGVALLAGLTLAAAVQTPVLPLVVTQVRTDDGPQYLRGSVISVDDVYLVLLQEHGGVRYLHTDTVESTVLCESPQQLPAFTTRVRDFHVEDSLLSAVGRHVRPRGAVDPLCRVDQSATT
jgi:hypothetical protein